MITIWKYPLGPDTSFLEMPQGAKILNVQVQNNQPVLYALVNTYRDKIKRNILITPTGGDLSNWPDIFTFATFIGSFQLYSGSLVFHVFDLG